MPGILPGAGRAEALPGAGMAGAPPGAGTSGAPPAAMRPVELSAGPAVDAPARRGRAWSESARRPCGECRPRRNGNATTFLDSRRGRPAGRAGPFPVRGGAWIGPPCRDGPGKGGEGPFPGRRGPESGRRRGVGRRCGEQGMAPCDGHPLPGGRVTRRWPAVRRARNGPGFRNSNFRQRPGHGDVAGISPPSLPSERLIVVIRRTLSGLAEIAGPRSIRPSKQAVPAFLRRWSWAYLMDRGCPDCPAFPTSPRLWPSPRARLCTLASCPGEKCGLWPVPARGQEIPGQREELRDEKNPEPPAVAGRVVAAAGGLRKQVDHQADRCLDPERAEE